MLDLQTLAALNKFWQEKFDKKHPEAARRRDARDTAVNEVRICKTCGKRCGPEFNFSHAHCPDGFVKKATLRGKRKNATAS